MHLPEDISTNPAASIEELHDVEDLGDLSVVDLGDMIFEMDRTEYSEKPVGIEEFITSKQFLGDIFPDDSFFPFWMDELNTIYPTPFYSPFNEVLAHLPIGSGKSFVASLAMTYDAYRVLCLKNPHKYFGLNPPDLQIAFVSISVDKVTAADVNWTYLKSFINRNNWFKNRGLSLPDSPRKSGVVLDRGVTFLTASHENHLLGRAVFGAVLDEANFKGGGAKGAHTLYTSIMRRMESRFMQFGGVIPGKVFLVSSPKDETSFLSERKTKAESSETSYCITDKPIWEIQRHKQIWCGDTFPVFLGNENLDPEILTEERLARTNSDDYALVVDVPVEYKESFIDDIVMSIRDIIGHSTSSGVKLFRMSKPIRNAMTIPHRFSKEEIILDFYDDQPLSDLCDVDYFMDPTDPDNYRAIHIDVGLTGDRFGLAASYAKFMKFNVGGETITDRMMVVDWAIGIKVKKDQEVPIYKVKDFIVWLRRQGYPISIVTADEYQSRQIRQDLAKQGFDVGYVSLDTSREPYLAFKQWIMSGRLILPKNQLLFREIRDLQDDGNKVDHPDHGSKDVSDSTAASAWSASSSDKVVRSKLNNRSNEGASGGLRGTLSKIRKQQTSKRAVSKRIYDGKL